MRQYVMVVEIDDEVWGDSSIDNLALTLTRIINDAPLPEGGYIQVNIRPFSEVIDC